MPACQEGPVTTQACHRVPNWAPVSFIQLDSEPPFRRQQADRQGIEVTSGAKSHIRRLAGSVRNVRISCSVAKWRSDPDQRHAGSKLIRRRVPVARAIFSSVRVDGWTRPLSSRATTDCVVSMRSANSACVNPAPVLASIRARASSNSAPSRSYASRYSGSWAPFLVQVGYLAHVMISPARRSANSISRRGVPCPRSRSGFRRATP